MLGYDEMNARRIAELGAEISQLVLARSAPRPDPNYKLSAAVRALVAGKPHQAEYEWTVSETLGRATGQQLRTGNSILVPTSEIVRYGLVRDLGAANAGAGGFLVGTENQKVVDFLRGRSVVGGFGATILSGLRGDVTLPKISTGATHTWLGTETAQAAEQTPATAQIALKPKTVAVTVDCSRQLLLQSNADLVFGRHLSDALAAAADSAALSGSSVSGQPTGLSNTAGVNAITGTSIDWGKVLDFIVNAGNANTDVSGFAMTPAVYKLLASREKATGSGMILTDGAIDRRPVMHSSSVPSATLMGGPWSECWIGEWGVVDLSFDPYTKFTSAIIGVRAMFSLDVAFRYPSAFSVASSIT